jgi:hypothetical protein
VGGSSNIPVLTSKRSCRPIRSRGGSPAERRSSMRSTFSRPTPATTAASLSGCRAGKRDRRDLHDYPAPTGWGTPNGTNAF